jgi:aspartyl protease family protein
MQKELAKYWLVVCTLLANLTAYGAIAAPQIKVVGLFKDTAIIRQQDNRETVLRTGMSTSNGLKLLSANSDYALFEYQGQRIKHQLTDSPVLSFAPAGASLTQEVRIPASNGMYTMSGLINGKPQNFILDTGASYVTLSTHHADQLGVSYRDKGKHIQLNTANGRTDAYLINLDKVTVGDIEVANVQAAVMENLSSDKILLGMSFLGNVSMTHEGQVMLLQKKP